MAKGPTSIPEQNAERAMQAANFGMDWMRQITEESLNQSRVMFEGFLSAARKTAESFDQQVYEVRERSTRRKRARGRMSAIGTKRTLRQFGSISSRRVSDLGQRTLPTMHVRCQNAANA